MDTTRFFNIVYIITLISCLSAHIYFLNTSWTCASHLGPFADTSDNIPINALAQDARTSDVSVVYSIVTGSLLYIFIATTFFMFWRFTKTRLLVVEMLMKKTEEQHTKEIANLIAEIDKKNKVI